MRLYDLYSKYPPYLITHNSHKSGYDAAGQARARIHTSSLCFVFFGLANQPRQPQLSSARSTLPQLQLEIKLFSISVVNKVRFGSSSCRLASLVPQNVFGVASSLSFYRVHHHSSHHNQTAIGALYNKPTSSMFAWMCACVYTCIRAYTYVCVQQ